MVYVGKTSNRPGDRFARHKYDARKGKQSDFHDALRNEPEPKFEVVETHALDREALRAEVVRINEYTTLGICLNKRRSTWGNGVGTDSLETREKKRQGRLGKKQPPSAIALLRAANLGKTSPRKGAKLTEETKDLIRAGVTGPASPLWKGDAIKKNSMKVRRYRIKLRLRQQAARVAAANAEPAPADFLYL